MSEVAIRKSGGANIVSLPKAIVHMLGLQAGSKLSLSVENNKIILTPVTKTLEELLAESPKACFKVTNEDRQWIDAPPQGKEI